jgi:type II secretory ATPase GspE/PulE/Tfp pilus assembly ATPase PilB-like protein
LVFSTLHTNDALGAIPRLIDMGVEPFLLASALTAIIGQRLVRCICPGCKVERTDASTVLNNLQVKLPEDIPLRLWTGRGCDACGKTGYKGRAGIYEIIPITDELHGPIVHGPDMAGIRAIIRRDGMATMFDDGLMKALQGITSLEEVLRVTGG